MLYQPPGISNKINSKLFVVEQPDYLPGEFFRSISNQNFFTGASINPAWTDSGWNNWYAASHCFKHLAFDAGANANTVYKHRGFIQVRLNIFDLPNQYHVFFLSQVLNICCRIWANHQKFCLRNLFSNQRKNFLYKINHCILIGEMPVMPYKYQLLGFT